MGALFQEPRSLKHLISSARLRTRCKWNENVATTTTYHTTEMRISCRPVTLWVFRSCKGQTELAPFGPTERHR